MRDLLEGGGGEGALLRALALYEQEKARREARRARTKAREEREKFQSL